MKTALAALAAIGLAAPVHAAGDAEQGARIFAKCKTCHSIASDTEVIVKGGKVGPNLYGVVGRPAASEPDFRYGKGIEAAAAKGLVWTEDEIAAYVQNPSKFLEEFTGDPHLRSKMTFKLPKGGEDVAAYLASLAPAAGDSANP
jgi:cytochrome c